MDEQITQDQVGQLLEAAAYMKDEAEALKYIIDQVPHQKQPPDGPSVAERLAFIDHVQTYYYRSSLEEAVDDARPIHIEGIKGFIEDYNPDDAESKDDIQSLLTNVAKHRAGLINSMKRVPAIEWDTDIYVADQKISLFKFIQQIVQFDHGQLKKIAGLVRAFNDQKQTQRQIKQKRESRNPSFEKSE